MHHPIRGAPSDLVPGEVTALAGEKIAEVRRRAEAFGRKVRFGLRINLIVRETKEEAWAAAQWLFDRIDRDVIETTSTRRTQTDSIGQQRMNQVIGDRLGNKAPRHARDLEIYPDIWAGFGLIRNGPGTAIVGDPETVAARLKEYADVGFDTFIVSGQPLLEEAYRVADLLLPLLPIERTTATEKFVRGGPFLAAVGARP